MSLYTLLTWDSRLNIQYSCKRLCDFTGIHVDDYSLWFSLFYPIVRSAGHIFSCYVVSDTKLSDGIAGSCSHVLLLSIVLPSWAIDFVNGQLDMARYFLLTHYWPHVYGTASLTLSHKALLCSWDCLLQYCFWCCYLLRESIAK